VFTIFKTAKQVPQCIALDYPIEIKVFFKKRNVFLEKNRLKQIYGFIKTDIPLNGSF
jgi:hypothetical protein